MEHTINDNVVIRVGKGSVNVPAKTVVNNFLAELLRPEAQTVITRRAVPMLGEAWEEQGGIYIGLLRDGNKEYHNIIALEGELTGVKWGERGKEISGCDSDCDGLANTEAMAAAGSELARDIIRMRLHGLDDWALPARHQLRLAYLNAPDSFDKDGWYWSSTQCSAGGAWGQGFADGYQYYWLKVYENRARAVRRFSTIE
jgi:hypothetical protein